MMMTKIMWNMKNRSHISANFRLEDLGRELISEERREAKTRNPVMAPMNLLLKSETSMKSVKYTRNHRRNVCKKIVMKYDDHIL